MNEHSPLTEGFYYILLSLYEPRHGYGIMQYVSEISNARVKLGAGTVYGAIKILMERKWIVLLDNEGRKKQYVITDEGKWIIEHEIKRFYELYQNGLKIAKGESP